MTELDRGKKSGYVLAGAALFGLVAIRAVYLGLTHNPRLNAPPWIAYLLAVLCATGSIALFSVWSGKKVNGDLFGFAFFGCFATVFAWVAISGATRGCSSSLDIVLPHGLGCRVMAGAFSLLFLPIAVLIGRRLLSR